MHLPYSTCSVQKTLLNTRNPIVQPTEIEKKNIIPFPSHTACIYSSNSGIPKTKT